MVHGSEKQTAAVGNGRPRRLFGRMVVRSQPTANYYCSIKEWAGKVPALIEKWLKIELLELIGNEFHGNCLPLRRPGQVGGSTPVVAHGPLCKPAAGPTACRRVGAVDGLRFRPAGAVRAESGNRPIVDKLLKTLG